MSDVHGNHDFEINRTFSEDVLSAHPLLKERNRTHGSFAANASISQAIKRLYTHADLTDVQRGALDMIALKISRIASGKAGVKDHWDDIAGYATLAANEL